MASEYGKLICPKCGNDSSQEGISYAYLEWRVHEVKEVIDNVVVMEGYSESEDVGWGGEKATATNVPDDQNDCAHFYCHSCLWNWWENKEKDFR